MTSGGVDAVVLSTGADLPYFTGYEAMPLERLTAFVVRADGDAVLFVPELEAPRVAPGPFELRAWGEGTDPVGPVVALLSGCGAVAVGDQTWSSFLLTFQEGLPGVRWSPASELTSELRMRKDPDEIEALRAAGAAVDRVLARIPDEVRFRGRTEAEVARSIVERTLEEGHDHATFWIVAAGPNAASPHHEPGGRVIEEGDLVVVDFGGRRSGYCSDVTRTFVVGTPSDEQRRVHAIVEAANQAGRDAVRPGVEAQIVDRAARAVIEDAGLGRFFIHRTGHGIGLEGHEHPYIIEGNELPLEPGMTFSVEPGIYVPDRLGVRIEDIVAVSIDGVDELNRADRSLVEVA
jgi:Xaa-Pro aminopeptidase